MKKTILASMLAVMMATPAFAAESTDIVIIGSGGAGLSSAITATEKGAKAGATIMLDVKACGPE